MSPKILFTLSILLTNCQSRENAFELEGKWVDVTCANSTKNCKSRYPEIVINSEISDSLGVMNQVGVRKKIWTNSKWQSFSLKLENDYESLLFPNYKTNTLQYYDNIEKEFVYYIKTPKP